MAVAVTLFDKALSHYNTATLLRNYMGDDEEQLNIIAFHLQQSLELSLKYVLELNGIEYRKTHNIEQLIRIADQNSVNIGISDYIEEHAEMFSNWEEKSRYILGYLVEKKKIDRALQEVDLYLKRVKILIM